MEPNTIEEIKAMSNELLKLSDDLESKIIPQIDSSLEDTNRIINNMIENLMVLAPSPCSKLKYNNQFTTKKKNLSGIVSDSKKTTGTIQNSKFEYNDQCSTEMKNLLEVVADSKKAIETIQNSKQLEQIIEDCSNNNFYSKSDYTSKLYNLMKNISSSKQQYIFLLSRIEEDIYAIESYPYRSLISLSRDLNAAKKLMLRKIEQLEKLQIKIDELLTPKQNKKETDLLNQTELLDQFLI